MKVYNSKKQAIELENTPLAKPGGEGAVYRIPSRPQYCAKVYHENRRDENRRKKLEYMVANPPSPLIAKTYIICWPTELIYDAQGRFMGFIMPLAFPNSQSTYDLCVGAKTLSEELRNYYDRKSAQGFVNRLFLIFNITIAIHAVHRMGKYVLVDLKPENMLATPHGAVSLIDIDSVQINDGRQKYLCPVFSSEYLPAELQMNPKLATMLLEPSCDYFALAVVFYRILFGLHPFACSAIDDKLSTIEDKIREGLFVHGPKANCIAVVPPPHLKFQKIPPQLKDLFIAAFGTKPSLRPNTDQWGKVLFEIVKAIQNKQ